jgi:phosphonoacetate hydrolase
MTDKIIDVNGRSFLWPDRPLVVICCDGSEVDYTEQAMAAGVMPNLKNIVAKGAALMAKSVVPSFTNPNNLSIVTGQPPEVHGICGNYLIDPETGQEVMMNDPKFLKVPTIFATFQQAGAKVAVVTAKDKLRLLLGKGLVFDGTAVSFSSEKSDQCTWADHGIENVNDMVGMAVPDVYSAELSEFVFAAGVKLLANMKPDLLYLSTTDYVQHKFAPGSEGANGFYAMMDKYLGQLDATGAGIVITADHGMKDKHLPDGTPDVLYLQDYMDEWLGKGAARVILPITDPYVVHHGALGSFATVYLPEGGDVDDIIARVKALEGIELCMTNEQGCDYFQLPRDRNGDLIVVSGGPAHTKVLGTSRDKHDLSGLKVPLRSHGGVSEQDVPFYTNHQLENLPDHLRNFDAFFVGCNCFVQGPEI